jgi:hypothetical protein
MSHVEPLLPKFKPLKADHVRRCSHVRSGTLADMAGAFMFRPVMRSNAETLCVVLCERCAIGMSTLIVNELKRVGL